MRVLPILKGVVTGGVPVYVHWGVTHRCNLRCVMCGLWKTADSASELDIGRVRAMAENLRRLGTQAISLGGGEPFLREDLPDVVEAFLSRGIEARVLTNGLECPRESLEELFRRGLRHISISLDTLDREKQARICQHDEIYARAGETIERCAQMLRRHGGLGVLNVVVSKLNLEELPYMVDFAGRYGFWCSFVPLELQRFAGQTLGCRDDQKDMELSAGDGPAIREIYERLLALKRQGGKIFNSRRFLELSSRALCGERVAWPCRAGSLYFSVDPAGSFSLCHLFRGTGVGETISVHAADFPARFSSRAFQAQCRTHACKSPAGCLRPCWTEVALALTNPMNALEALRLQSHARRRNGV